MLDPACGVWRRRRKSIVVAREALFRGFEKLREGAVRCGGGSRAGSTRFGCSPTARRPHRGSDRVAAAHLRRALGRGRKPTSPTPTWLNRRTAIHHNWANNATNNNILRRPSQQQQHQKSNEQRTTTNNNVNSNDEQPWKTNIEQQRATTGKNGEQRTATNDNEQQRTTNNDEH